MAVVKAEPITTSLRERLSYGIRAMLAWVTTGTPRVFVCKVHRGHSARSGTVRSAIVA